MSRFALLAALLVALSACQTTGGNVDDCFELTDENRDRCQTGDV